MEYFLNLCFKEELVEAFEMDELPVTNREFIEFIESGQYENQANWDPLDWQWKQKHKLCHPASLKLINGKWMV